MKRPGTDYVCQRGGPNGEKIFENTSPVFTGGVMISASEYGSQAWIQQVKTPGLEPASVIAPEHSHW